MRAYVSCITNDGFLPGALMVFRSLKRSQLDATIELCIVITKDVSSDAEAILVREGVTVIREDVPLQIDIGSLNEGDGQRWKTTFEKISIFRQIQYEKLVYLDADMIVLNCIDDAFSYPHMSAVESRSVLPEGGHMFNSGIMVIEPNNVEYEAIVNSIPLVIRSAIVAQQPIGDQNVLNAFFDQWPKQMERHLPDAFNVFFGSIERYWDVGYALMPECGKKAIRIIHFTGSHKPWSKRVYFWSKAIFRSIRYHHRLPRFDTFKVLHYANRWVKR